MKKIMVLFLFALSLQFCSNSSKDNVSASGRFGDTSWTEEAAIPASEIMQTLANKDSQSLIMIGKITSCCQAKGCWMTVDAGNGQEINVKFKDYGFFVPKNSAEHETVMRGVAYIDTVSVAELQEHARDAEKNEEEIASIISPEVKLSFIADGVIIRE